MNVTDCYRTLGLRSQASLDEVKAAYRRLARQYHPDTNPGDRDAHEKFIQLHEAYRILQAEAQSSPTVSEPIQTTPTSPQKVKVTRQPKEAVFRDPPNLSESEKKLKRQKYEQLQNLFREQKLPRAVALIEGLAQRIPQDTEIRQWQAVTYQRFGRDLIERRKLDQARRYLKKALRTDPHNRALWLEVERDFRRMERILG